MRRQISMIRPFKIGCSCIAGRQIVSDCVNKVYPSINTCFSRDCRTYKFLCQNLPSLSLSTSVDCANLRKPIIK